MSDAGRAAAAGWLRIQASWCERLGSPLYAVLLARAAEDCERGGPVWEVLHGREDDPPGSALALRFMGAVHRLVLEGRAPELARVYPSAGGDPAAGDEWAAFRVAVAANATELRALVLRPVQTNEVGRSAALLGGFLTVAAEHGLPLRLLEVGSAAGLNLRWDGFRYESGDWWWGEPGSPVRFRGVFSSDARPPAVPAVIAGRAGCDLAPVDPTTPDGRLTLQSYLWPDQVRRFEALRGALEVAASVPAAVEPADGPSWLEGRLSSASAGIATVVFHSIVAQYLGEEGRERLAAVLLQAGARCGPDSPLAWLRLEPSRPDGGGEFLVHLTVWPEGKERLLAEAHPHGPPVRWLA